MTNYVDELHDRLKRQAEMKKWKARFKRLKKKHGMSVAFFASKHKFDDSLICHQIAGRRGAKWDYIARVDEALKAEGV
jgi:hypothetical protein